MNNTETDRRISRREILFVLIILGLMLAVMATSIIHKSATYDEVIHVPVGFSYWMTEGYVMDPGAPPLVKMIDTIPLLFMNLNFKVEGQAWLDNNDLVFGHSWLYGQSGNPDGVVNAARYMVMILSLLTALLVWYWSRELFGKAAAAGALVIYSFEPTIIAHSSLATLDVGSMFFGMLSLWTFYRYLRYRTIGSLVISAIVFGLFQLTKFSSIIFAPIFVLLFILALAVDWRQGKPLRLLRHIGHIIAFIVISYSVIATIYSWQGSQILTGDADRIAKYDTALQALGPLHDPVMWFLTEPKVPAGKWFTGMMWQVAHSRRGHPAYLMGQYSEQGWWYYYPVAYLLKTPIPMLLLLLGGMIAFIRSRRIDALSKGTILTTLAVFGFFTVTNNIDIGVRYLLPIYPLLVICAAAVIPQSLAARRQLATGGFALLMVGWLIVESFSIYPNYLTYFNQIGGGPRGGIRYLADSNIDWGQDLKGLAEYVNETGYERVVVSYFGTANLDYYQFPYRMFTDYEIHNPKAGIYAVSVNNLLCVFTENKTDYAWLRKLEPTAIIGNSIYVYCVKNSDIVQSP